MTLEEKEEQAIYFIKHFQPKDGYYLAFSGGKDSIVLYHLTQRAGVKFDAHYNVTNADPPEVINFIRVYYPMVSFDKPKRTLWELIQTKNLPSRKMRWCCALLKERGGIGRTVLTGVRWSESPRRKNHDVYEHCYQKNRFSVNPILDWTDKDVWNYIFKSKIPYCSLYNEGFTRIGCVGCPLAGRKKRLLEAERFPKIIDAWRRAAVRLYNKRIAQGKTKFLRWKSGEEMFDWWLNCP